MDVQGMKRCITVDASEWSGSDILSHELTCSNKAAGFDLLLRMPICWDAAVADMKAAAL